MHEKTWINVQGIMPSEEKKGNYCIIVLYLYITVLRWQNYRTREQIRGCQRLRRTLGQEGSSSDHKGNLRDPLIEMFSILILSMIISWLLYCIFARCYHWGKLGKGYMGSLCIISYNFISYNYFKIQNNKASF